MAFVKTKDQAQLQNRVGGSYGERRAVMQNPASHVNVQKPAVQKPQDKFSNSGTDKRNVDSFTPNANFRRQAPVTAPGIPYKRAMHDHVERGSAPVNSGKNPPSDDAILRFLDKVIASEPARREQRSNVSINSKTLNKVKSNPSRAPSAVAPSLPRSARPIPTLSKTATNKA